MQVNFLTHVIFYDISLNFVYLTGGEWIATSFCPALGKMYALEHPDRCPAYLQEPHGKTLNVSFIGHPPFITYNPVGGSDLILINLLAKKFKFFPKYLPAATEDKLESNISSNGTVHLVSTYQQVVHKF